MLKRSQPLPLGSVLKEGGDDAGNVMLFFSFPSRLRNVEKEFGESEDVRKKQRMTTSK